MRYFYREQTIVPQKAHSGQGLIWATSKKNRLLRCPFTNHFIRVAHVNVHAKVIVSLSAFRFVPYLAPSRSWEIKTEAVIGRPGRNRDDICANISALPWQTRFYCVNAYKMQNSSRQSARRLKVFLKRGERESSSVSALIAKIAEGAERFREKDYKSILLSSTTVLLDAWTSALQRVMRRHCRKRISPRHFGLWSRLRRRNCHSTQQARLACWNKCTSVPGNISRHLTWWSFRIRAAIEKK